MTGKKLFYRLVFIGAVVASTLSCDKPKNGELTLTISPEEPFVIPDAMYSCVDIVNVSSTKSLSKSSVKYRLFDIEWPTADEMELVQISVKFRSSGIDGGEKKYTIAGDELEAMFGTGTFTGPTTISVNTSCGLRAGGLTFEDDTKPAVLNVDIKVTGVATDDNGDQYAVYGTTTVSARYDGN